MRIFAAVVLTALALPGASLAVGDATRGETLFSECAACHTMEPDPKMLGPHLKAIIGRKAGGLDDYVYSPPMRRSTVVWTAETLDAFLVDPQAVIPGAKMPFAGMPTAQDREDLITYLAGYAGQKAP